MIIAFAGRKQSGKTSACEFVSNVCYGYGINNIQIYNFADPLKDLCINILGLEHNQCYGSDEEKNELVDCYWQDKQLTAREVMQLVGTNMFRAIQHNVWSDATIRRIKKDKPDLALIADCRFPNEVDAIKNAGGFVIKLTRNLYSSTHESEIALDPDQYDNNNFDLVIDNQDIPIGTKNNLIYNFLLEKEVIPS
jgi:hypothetical protein